MKTDHLYVAWQDFESREWVPVAVLRRTSAGYVLSYTAGVKRCKGFAGLGRMSDFGKAYVSATLFPFFSNRLISKSRPEYRRYLEWLGVDEAADDPMSILALTGGVRTTDSFELIAPPQREGDQSVLHFFARGLRYMGEQAVHELSKRRPGDRLFLTRDIQNARDSNALILRTEEPPVMVGYVPRYYCPGINALLADSPSNVVVEVKRINPDAPQDMRLLCQVSAAADLGLDLLQRFGDFEPLSTTEVAQVSEAALERAVREFGD